MSTDRDTHFANAAKLLLQALMGKYDHLPPGEFGPAEKDEQIIAHFAYDLVFSGLKQYPLTDAEAHRHIARNFPDLTEWPPAPSVEQAP